jgi:hypothetical protein
MSLEQLEQDLAGMLSPLDIPRSWSFRELNEYETRRAVLTVRIRTIRSCTTTLAEVDPQLRTLTTWRDHLTTWRKTLLDRLEALPPARTGPELGAQQNLKRSILQIDRGLDFRNGAFPVNLPLDDLMRADGLESPRGTLVSTCGEAWRGSMPLVEQRLAQLQQQHNDAQQQLDDAMLSDADREQKAKDAKARADALNALPRRKTRGDGTQFDKYPDGRRVEVSG